jgi:quinol monooxygenase YgiN
VAAALHEMAPLTRAEPGCVCYFVHRSERNPSEFFLYELYKSQSALEEHKGSAHFKRYIKREAVPLLEANWPAEYTPFAAE